MGIVLGGLQPWRRCGWNRRTGFRTFLYSAGHIGTLSCYTAFVPKNISVKLSDETALWVRRKAAEENTSVSRLLSQLLEREMRLNDAYWRAFDHWNSHHPLAAAGAGRLSWQVLHEFYWNAVRKMGLSSADARRIVEDLWHWRPIEASLPLVREAWQWVEGAQLSYWDALIVAAAQRAGARYLLSEDFQEERTFGEVKVLNPFRHSPSEFSWSSLRN